MHCSDKSLLAYLDAELPVYRRYLVGRHLETCRRCRFRLEEIHQQVLAVIGAIREDSFAGPDLAVEASLQFLARADDVAAEVFAARAVERRLSSPPLWCVAAAMIALAVLSWWTVSRRSAAPRAPELISRAVKAETPPPGRPVEQRFRIRVREIRPAPSVRESRLAVWYEPARQRFASRLEDERGVLRHAAWQPEPARRYVYNPARRQFVVPARAAETAVGLTPALLRTGLRREDLEAALLTWLESRRWEPISLASGMAQFIAAEGAELRIETAQSPGEPRRYRLHGRRTAGAVTVAFLMEAAEPDYRPRVCTIRYESAERELELSFTPEAAENFTPVSYEPPDRLLLRAVVKRHVPPAPVPVPANLPALAPAPDATAVDIEIHAALHRLKACLGEPIEVLREPDGTVRVRGMVSGTGRRDDLLAALAPYVERYGVKVELQTANEVIREVRADQLTTPSDPAPVAQPPLHAYLVRHFAAASKKPEREAERFADDVLSRNEQLMAEAWALRHLARRFGGRDAGLAPAERLLLKSMLLDHLDRLRAGLSTQERSVAPVLSSLASALPPERPLRDAEAAHSWNQQVLALFDRMVLLNKRTLSLFTGAPSAVPAEQPVAELFDRIHSVELALQDSAVNLMAAFPATAAP